MSSPENVAIPDSQTICEALGIEDDKANYVEKIGVVAGSAALFGLYEYESKRTPRQPIAHVYGGIDSHSKDMEELVHSSTASVDIYQIDGLTYPGLRKKEQGLAEVVPEQGQPELKLVEPTRDQELATIGA